MFKLIRGFMVATCIMAMTGCGSDSIAQESTDDELVTCTGFGSPLINVFVRDSLNGDSIIETATVTIISNSDSEELRENAVFTPSDDNSEDTLTGAYFSILNLNESTYEVSILVFADGYHPFVTKRIDFLVNTSCGASNDLTYNVYLCPLGTACI